MSATAQQPAADRAARGYYAIAHRAGNNLHALEQALDAGVDAIECDLWHYHGKLALRHERKLPALPVLYDRWYVRWSWGVLGLRRLLQEIGHRTELFLDIKSSTPRAADSVLELYHDNEAMMPRASVSSQRWHVLDRLAEARTDLRLFYSVKDEAGLAALLERAAQARRPHGTSIRHTLLSPQRIEQLHAAGLEVYAWTVNNPHRGDELRAWGADGLIADNLDVLR